MSLVLILAGQRFGTDSLAGLVAVAGAAVLTYGAAYLLLGRGLSEREMVVSGIARIGERWKARG